MHHPPGTRLRGARIPGPLRGLLLLLACWGALAAATLTEARGEDGYILLQNGNVMRGEVVTLGNQTVIRRDNVERLKLHASDVAHSAATIHELYQYRATKREKHDLQGLLEDARWCFRNGLLAEADQVLKLAESLAPGYPATIRLRRQWQVAVQPKTAASVDSVQVVDFEEPVEKSAGELADAELDRELEDLGVPEGALAHFSRQVQPLLISRCGNNGCHRSPTERGWELTHRGTHVRPPGRMTKQNLAKSLAWVNREVPGQSELLRYALLAHGGRKDAAVKQADDPALPVLRGWADAVAAWDTLPTSDSPTPLTKLAPLPENPLAVPLGPTPVGFAVIPAQPVSSPAADGQVRQASHMAGAVDRAPGRAQSGDSPIAPVGYDQPTIATGSPAALGQGSPAGLGTGAPKRVSRLPAVGNPFDPEIFNRSYRHISSPPPPAAMTPPVPPPSTADGPSAAPTAP